MCTEPGSSRVLLSLTPGDRANDAATLAGIGRALGDDVDVGDDLVVTPDRARDLGVSDVGMLHDVGEKEVRFDRRRRKALEVRVAPENLDPSENPLRRLLAELGQFGQLAILRHALEIFQRLNAERVVNDLNLGGVESRNPKELQQSFGDSLAQLVEIRRLAGLDQLADHRERRGSDPWCVRQLARAQQGGEIVGVEGDERARRPGVCPRLEFLLAFHFEECADL